jgi:hypothetical protein
MGGGVGVDEVLEVRRSHTFGCFEGQHQSFVFRAGRNRKPVEAAEKGRDM